MNEREYINSLVRGDSLAQAYIIEGEDEGARRGLAGYFVKAALCTSPNEDGSPCGTCSSCVRCTSGTHEDVVVMTRKGRTQYLVEDSQAFLTRIAMRPYGRRMVGIIPEADRLSPVIQNKLLKYIEEPAPDTVLILELGNRDALLPTVQSRCIKLRARGDLSGASADGDGEEGFFEARDPEEKDWSPLIASLAGSGEFYLFRKAMESAISSQSDALDLLDSLETAWRGGLGDREPGATGAIILVEECRKQIMEGMAHKTALKQLFLKLH